MLARFSLAKDLILIAGALSLLFIYISVDDALDRVASRPR
jgi:hypothetical protein